MATYFRTDDEGGRHATSLRKPTPAHAQTKAAKRARKAVRASADAGRTRLTRADVEAAYVHPAPEVEAHEISLANIAASGARSLAKVADNNGHRVKATYNRGTTQPKWHVNAPDNKTNPGPTVDPSQYYGEVVDCETVYVVTVEWNESMRDMPVHRIRGVWLNGKLDHIEIDGQPATLKAAREVLS